jgi:hypothetical protein
MESVMPRGKEASGEARQRDTRAAPAAPQKAAHEKPAAHDKQAGHDKQEDRSGQSSHRLAATATTDHDEIRRWVEERGGRPSVVKGSRDREGGGILRIDFAEPDESLEEISWEEFFKIFEDRKLAFLHQDRTADGHLSRFFKFVRRDEEH